MKIIWNIFIKKKAKVDSFEHLFEHLLYLL